MHSWKWQKVISTAQLLRMYFHNSELRSGHLVPRRRKVLSQSQLKQDKWKKVWPISRDSKVLKRGARVSWESKKYCEVSLRAMAQAPSVLGWQCAESLPVWGPICVALVVTGPLCYPAPRPHSAEFHREHVGDSLQQWGLQEVWRNSIFDEILALPPQLAPQSFRVLTYL